MRRGPLVAIGVAAVVAAVGAVALVTAPAARAHSVIVASTPAEGEILTELPEAFSVTANETLLDLGTQGVFQLQIRDADGGYYGDGCVTLVDDTMSATPSLGESGDYVMLWQVVSADGHPVSGSVSFTWEAPDGFPAATARLAPPVCGEDPSATPAVPEPGDYSWAPTVLIGAGAVVVALVGAYLYARRTARTAKPDES